MRRSKAKGYPGSWFADVDDERLPCVHDCYRTKDGRDYFDRYSGLGLKKWENFVEAIRSGRCVIVTVDKILSEGPNFQKSFKRKGYVGVFEVADVEADSEGLRFRFVQQLADLTDQ